jgi:hypothetical protein
LNSDLSYQAYRNCLLDCALWIKDAPIWIIIVNWCNKM